MDNRLDEVYVLSYHIDTLEGVSHVINCILDGEYENECIFTQAFHVFLD